MRPGCEHVKADHYDDKQDARSSVTYPARNFRQGFACTNLNYCRGVCLVGCYHFCLMSKLSAVSKHPHFHQAWRIPKESFIHDFFDRKVDARMMKLGRFMTALLVSPPSNHRNRKSTLTRTKYNSSSKIINQSAIFYYFQSVRKFMFFCSVFIC